MEDLPATAVIVLTVSEEAEGLAAALHSGAQGYLLKNIETEAPTAALRRAASGEPVLSGSMTARYSQPWPVRK